MNILPLRTASLIALTFITAVSFAQEPPPRQATLADLDWLVGTWEGATPQRSTDEVWTDARGGIMLGFNRVVTRSESARTTFEFLRLQETEDGITYYASPSGKPPVGFRLIKLEGPTAVFENPEHDFPQRIIYRRVDDEMRAAIEGEIDGQVQRREWKWKRKL